LDDIIKNSTGVSYPAIQSSKLIAMLLPLPPLSEQETIARYLDTKVGEIDQKVSLIEKKIEHYQLLKKSIINKVVTKGLHPEAPLKDSQISWLGQIPAHWEEKRLKDLGYFYGGLSGKSGEDFQNEDEDVIKPFIPYTNILNNFYVNPEVVKYVVINDNESQNTIQKGDLLFLMSSEDYESIAKASVVNEEVDELYLNSFCKGMRITNKQIYSPFLCYLLSNNDCRDSLRFEAQGFTRINIKTGKVACASIIIPPLSEQQEIASYLDQKCADIDAIIANCTAQIEKYKTLKRALINEVVTGQRTIE
jgi:type I restriction enzyme S subunit